MKLALGLYAGLTGTKVTCWAFGRKYQPTKSPVGLFRCLEREQRIYLENKWNVEWWPEHGVVKFLRSVSRSHHEHTVSTTAVHLCHHHQQQHFYFAPRPKYCDERGCLSVCLCVRSYISETTRPNDAKFSVHVDCGRGSVLLWRRCDMLCTSGFAKWRHVFICIMGPMVRHVYF